MAFHVGQRVEYFDAKPNCWGDSPTELVIGRIYTIRAFSQFNGLLLNEMPSPSGYDGYHQWRFRAVTDRKSSISFTEGAPKDSEKWDNRNRVKVRS